MQAQTKAMVDEVLANPPKNEDALRMACALHKALSMSVKLRVVIFGADPSEIKEDMEAIRALWEVITKAAEELFPADAQDKEGNIMEDPMAATDFNLVSEDGTKGVNVRVVSDEEMQAAVDEDAEASEEDCDCPACRFRTGLIEALTANRDGMPSGNVGAMFDEKGQPDYSARPFWKPPVRNTFAVPGNNTIH